VIYRIRAVEVLAGQNPQQAFSSNAPLFERKVNNMLQILWPAEITIPTQGMTIAWSVQPEDLSGMALITPEGFAPPFALKFLPVSEQCLTLLEKLKYSLKILLAFEERYWHEYDLVERAEHLQEEAEDRGDAYEVEHWQTKLVVSTQSLVSTKDQYEAAYTAYETALEAYKNCAEQPVGK
ncbi:MAG TPA: hypothetical protein VJ508_15795, partial [Saprospiraceae bacterium]|nr:hypothetical protein [Saprospiraceae bacterium]